MSVPANVSMLNASDIVPLNPTHIANMGTNFKFLQDSALYSLKWTFIASPTSLTSQVGAITADQVQALNQQQIMIITAAQLAALREETIAAIPLEVRQSIRSDQKSFLTPSQAAYFK